MELPCIMFTFPTKIFWRGGSGLVTGCPFGSWVSGLTTSPLYVGPIFLQTYSKADMSTARQCLKSPRSLSATSTLPTMVILVNIMVMNEWLTSFSFHVDQPSHSWDKAISESDLETPRSRSWVWSKAKAIQSAQYPINSLPFHSTSIRPIIPEIQLFRNSTLKHPRSRSWVRSKVKVTYPVSNQCTFFCFTSIRRTNPEITHTPLQLCTHDQIHWISYVHPIPVDSLVDSSLYRQIFTMPPPRAATIYNIALWSLVHVVYAVYTLTWLQTLLPFCCIPFFIPTFMWFMVGAGVTGWPFLAFLDDTPHKQCLIIILYPAWDSTTFCCFSWLRSYFRPTAFSSWWGNALGFSKQQIYGVSMMTITIVYSLWHHNDMYCCVTTHSQGKALCLLMLEFKCHLPYCSSQEVDMSLSHTAVIHNIPGIWPK